MGARIQNILSLLKIVIILAFSMAIFGNNNPVESISAPTLSTHTGFQALGLCLISVFFTFGGYQQTINFGADIKNPKRNIPLAIVTGISIILVLYLLINVAYCQVLGFENMKAKPLLAAELAKKFFGEAGFKITSIVLFVSVLGFINTSLMSNPRVYYAMAEDKILPSIFKRVNDKTQTQEFALTFFFVLTLISMLLLDVFEKIINYIMFIDSISLIFAAATIFILRKRMADVDFTGFRLKLFPYVPLLFMIVLFVVCLSVTASDTLAARVGVGIFIGGVPLYYILRKFIK